LVLFDKTMEHKGKSWRFLSTSFWLIFNFITIILFFSFLRKLWLAAVTVRVEPDFELKG
jgi:hypothetical protein